MNNALHNIFTGSTVLTKEDNETIYSNASFENEMIVKEKPDCWDLEAINRLEFYRDLKVHGGEDG